MRKWILLFAGLAVMSTSCVSMKKYRSAAKDLEKCQKERSTFEKQIKDYNALAAQFDKQTGKLRAEIARLEKDTAMLGQAKRDAEMSTSIIGQRYEDLKTSNAKAAQMSDKELRSLLAELQKSQEMLLRQEDDLKTVRKALEKKQDNIAQMLKELEEKEKRVIELEMVLAKKDSAVSRLRRSLNEALVGFVGNGLSVDIKNGKVYVSMEESLLFKSASWQVSPEGSNALKKLAKVLEDQTDINIMVEGHTDNVPYKGSGNVKDNWDLSVMRATSVARIILDKSKIKPERIITAGRSEYVPLDSRNLPASRAKNRRTEIILTPKLDELLKIIESN